MLLSLMALYFCLSPRYDISQVHPSIRDLKPPYRQVKANYFLDGGSIGMEITDHDGQKLQLAIPISDGIGDARTYHRLYLGAKHTSFSNAVEVAFTADTRKFLVDMLDNQASGIDRNAALIALRGSPLDYVKVYTWSLFEKNRP